MKAPTARRFGLDSTRFAAGLGAVIAAAAAAAALAAGGTWALGVAVGGVAVAVDIYLLVRAGDAWWEGARGRRRVVWKGGAALVAKALLTPAALLAACAAGSFKPAAVGVGALVAAGAAPIWLTAVLWRRGAAAG